jgi:predicted 3-demethylubiquinone-9 3-methyltransferase (glyoxalase superfamily)
VTTSLTPFLMFQGKAEEAINLYTSLFKDAKVENLKRFPVDGTPNSGKVMMATLTIHGQTFRINDSMVGHKFTFTPSFSMYVECESAAELDTLFGKLSEGGGVMMAAANHGFSPRFGWVADRFGVSWQLNFGSLSFEA